MITVSILQPLLVLWALMLIVSGDNCYSILYTAVIKAETHDATNRCDTSPRQVAATNRLV